MLRTLAAVIIVPLVALAGWLALGEGRGRADFVVTATEPRTLDPHRVSLLHEIQLAAAMFEGLTRLNAQTFQPEPAVAERWDVAPDGRTYTFHLRPDVRWSTGEPVTAEDFRAGWLRVLDPRSECQYASLLFAIRGAEAYYRARIAGVQAFSSDSVGVQAIDPRTLRVELAGPCPYFLELTSFITFVPAHRPTLERWVYRDGQVLRVTQHLWTRPGHIVCNGPFVLTRWDFKRGLWLDRNPHYWDAPDIAIDSLEVVITGDTSAALVAYETGRVDLVRWLDRPVAEALSRARQAGRRADFRTGDRFCTFFYRVNCRRPPLDNADFRLALALALDRPALCEHVLRLGEAPALTLVPPHLVHLMPRKNADGATVYYQPPAGAGATLSPAERVRLAREHLQRSGFGTRSPRRPIEVLVPSGDLEQRALAEAIKAMWERDLGILVEIGQVEIKVLSSRVRDLDYDLARSDWFGDYLDPSTFLGLFTTESGQNRTGWSNAEYDRLIAAAAAEQDEARRLALYAEAEALLCERELPIIPVFHRRGNYLLNPRFTGVNDNPRDLLQLHRARMRGSD
ncbi:MAG: peptide ABC transporter substrate-binding protein [Planctomycetota bacterium]